MAPTSSQPLAHPSGAPPVRQTQTGSRTDGHRLHGRAAPLAALLLAMLGAPVAAGPSPDASSLDRAAGTGGSGDETAGPSAQGLPAEAAMTEPPAPPDGAPRWLDAVRAQRQALQDLRRAEHHARRRAFDPVGAARHEAMEEEFFRRRQEMRDQMAEDRWWFLNFGPWMAPLPSPPGALSSPRQATPPDSGMEHHQASEAVRAQAPPQHPDPPEWDNGWYFHGW